MKKSIIFVFGLLLGTSLYAADQEHNDSATVDQSKNPITGTVTTTKEWKHKHKGIRGKKESKTKETTKEMTDGSVQKKTEVDSKTDSDNNK